MLGEEHDQERFARIMIEGGCRIEEVALLFGWTIADTLQTIAPALKANPEEAKRVRRIIGQITKKTSATPFIHRATGQQKPGAKVYSLHTHMAKRVA